MTERLKHSRSFAIIVMMFMKIPMTLIERFAKARFKQMKIIAWNKLTNEQRALVVKRQKFQELMMRAMSGDPEALVELKCMYEAKHTGPLQSGCHECGESHCQNCQGCSDEDEDDSDSFIMDRDIN